MFLIDKRGNRPVCASCHRLGPYMQETSAVFVCEACAQAVEDICEPWLRPFPNSGITG